MHNDRTAILLHLLSLTGGAGGGMARPELVAWLTLQLDRGSSVEQVVARYAQEQQEHRPLGG